MAQTHALAEKDYILGMNYQDIAAKYGVSENTVKSWRKRHGWPIKRKKMHPLHPQKCEKIAPLKTREVTIVPSLSKKAMKFKYCL